MGLVIAGVCFLLYLLTGWFAFKATTAVFLVLWLIAVIWSSLDEL